MPEPRRGYPPGAACDVVYAPGPWEEADRIGYSQVCACHRSPEIAACYPRGVSDNRVKAAPVLSQGRITVLKIVTNLVRRR